MVRSAVKVWPADEARTAGNSGLGIDDDLLRAMRPRRDAFEDDVAQDRSSRPVDAGDLGEAGKAADDTDAQLLSELKEAHRRVEMRVVDPLKLLRKTIFRPNKQES